MVKSKSPVDEREAVVAGMGESCPCLESLARCLIRWKTAVIAFWLLLMIALVPSAMRFMDVLKISLNPSPGTDSVSAQAMFEKHFPANAYNSRFVGLVEAAEGAAMDIPGISDFSKELHRRLEASRPLTSYYSVNFYHDLTAPLGDAAPEMPVKFISEDKTATLFTWAIAADPAGKESMEWALTSSKIFTDLVASSLGDAVSFSGTESYSEVAGQSISVARADLEKIDMVSMPFTVFVMFLVVESWRLLLIPGVTAAVSATVSFAATALIGLIIPVQAFTPMLMMCLVISLSIDYNIFMLTRFREELVASKVSAEIVDRSRSDEDLTLQDRVEAAVCVTMRTSGATILLSGFALFFAFLFVALFPVDIVASMGLGSCVTMILLVVVNLTLVPALLASFPVFFTSGLAEPSSPLSVRCHDMAQAGWQCLAMATTTFPMNLCLLLLVVGIAAALSVPLLHVGVSMDMRQVIANPSRLQQTADRIHTKFGGGLGYPFELLLVPTDDSVPVLSDKFFRDSGHFVQAVAREVEERLPEAKGTSYNFISYQTGTGTVPFEDMSQLCSLEQTAAPFSSAAKSLRRLQSDDGMPDMTQLCSYYLDSTTNTDDYRKVAPTAAYGVIVASLEPLSHTGHKLLAEFRRASAKFAPKYGLEVAILGTPTKALDMMETVYKAMPVAVIATLATASIFLLLAFRSLVIPVRSMLSNLLTLGVCYGTTVLVFQDGVIDFLHFSGVNGNYNAVPWFAPVVAFFIITGIGLDYDIFLLVRVTELRAKGLDPQKAVQEGLIRTGGIITACGMVMVFAFAGMLFSALVQANTYGFMMVLAVLFDTFVARSVVNPAGMSLLGYWNWWPSALSTAMPPEDMELSPWKPIDTFDREGA